LISGALGIGVGTKNFGVRRPVKLGAGIGGGLESSFCIHPCFFMLGGISRLELEMLLEKLLEIFF
jgi:hypothetical protein